MSNTLRSESLVKIYKKRKVVNKASVQVSKGEIVGLLGPNGAGKTTTFYMITGMIKPDAGKVFLDDEEITKIPMYKRARMGIGYLPQEASIFRRMTVEENILAVLEMTSLDKEARIKKCESLLDELSIDQIRKSKGFQLSGGERRRNARYTSRWSSIPVPMPKWTGEKPWPSSPVSRSRCSCLSCACATRDACL